MSELFNGNPEGQSPQNSPAPQAQQAPEGQAVPQSDPHADLLASITAEDGRQKYADVTTALQSIPHAQGRINELSSELSQLREELTKRKGAEDLLAQLQASQDAGADTPTAAGLDVEAVNQLIAQSLEAQKVQSLAEANKQKVLQHLTSLYGESAEAEFNKRAQALGVTTEYLTQQALTHPDFVMAQFAGKSAEKGQPLATPGLNTAAQQPAPRAVTPVMHGATHKQVVDAYAAALPTN